MAFVIVIAAAKTIYQMMAYGQNLQSSGRLVSSYLKKTNPFRLSEFNFTHADQS